jgi:hypothetical protein
MSWKPEVDVQTPSECKSTMRAVAEKVAAVLSLKSRLLHRSQYGIRSTVLQLKRQQYRWRFFRPASERTMVWNRDGVKVKIERCAEICLGRDIHTSDRTYPDWRKARIEEWIGSYSRSKLFTVYGFGHGAQPKPEPQHHLAGATSISYLNEVVNWGSARLFWVP